MNSSPTPARQSSSSHPVNSSSTNQSPCTNLPPIPLTILQWNCRSLPVAKDQLTQFLSHNSFQVIALQSISISSKFKFPVLSGFHYPPFFSQSSPDGPIRTAIYVSAGLAVNPILPPFKVDSPASTSSCKITLINGKQIMLLNYYNPIGTKDFSWVSSIPENWIIVGDFNAHHPLWESNCLYSNTTVGQIFQDSNICILNNGSATRLASGPHQKNTTPDLTFVSPNLTALTDWEVIPDPMTSDHLPIQITVQLSPTIFQTINSPKFNFEKANWEKYQQILTSCQIDFNDFHDNIDALNDKITDFILNAAKQSIPIYSPKHKKGNPWWNNDCKNAIKTKRKAIQNYLKLKKQAASQLTISNTFKAMKAAKLLANRTIAKAKKQYWEKTTKENNTDLRTMWDRVKKIKNIYNPPQSTLITPQGQNLNSPKEITEGFASYFAKNSHFSSLTQEQLTQRLAEESTMDLSPPKTNDQPITFFELVTALRKIKKLKTAPGIDKITPQLLKHLPPTFLKILHQFFNLCWSQGYMPDVWKQSIIVPICKPGKPRKQMTSYRPVSLTSHLGKFYERIITERLVYFTDKHHLIPLAQAGFRKKRSTTDHLVKLNEHIKQARFKRRIMLSCFLDITKAFDTVWHAKLLSRLKSWGIPTNLYKSIFSFLSHRTISVKYLNSFSSHKSVNMGVPQGSVIAPLLFSLSISDILKGVDKNAHVVIFADDVAIWTHTNVRRSKISKFFNKTFRFFQKQVNTIVTNLTRLGFTPSPGKSTYVPFIPTPFMNPLKEVPLVINNQNLLPAKSVKYLGVYFQSNGSWATHVKHAITKARRATNLIKTVSKENWGNDRSSLVALTTSLVRSRLMYGSQVLYNLPSSYLSQLVAVECSALRIALGLTNSTPVRKIYNEAGLLPLWHAMRKSTCRYIFTSAAIPNSTDDELSLNFNKSTYQHKHHGIITDSLSLCHKAGVLPSDRHNFFPNNDPFQPPLEPIPPWERIPPDVQLDIPQYNSKDNPTTLLPEVNSYLKTNILKHFCVFTDGSVLSDGKTGAGLYFPSTNSSISIKLPNTTIQTAELCAIESALDIVSHYNPIPKTIYILSDSKASLQILLSNNNTICPKICESISGTLRYLNDQNITTKFQWVPSHIGIYGNEKADIAAKFGAQKQNEIDVFLSPSIHDYSLKISKAVWADWKTEYNRYAFDRNWKTAHQQNSKSTHFSNYPTAIANIMSRIRVGHHRTKYTGTQCICSHPISFNHCLFDCPLLRDHFTPIQNFSLDQLQQLDGTSHQGWYPLLHAALLIYSSPVASLL